MRIDIETRRRLVDAALPLVETEAGLRVLMAVEEVEIVDIRSVPGGWEYEAPVSGCDWYSYDDTEKLGDIWLAGLYRNDPVLVCKAVEHAEWMAAIAAADDDWADGLEFESEATLREWGWR